MQFWGQYLVTKNSAHDEQSGLNSSLSKLLEEKKKLQNV